MTQKSRRKINREARRATLLSVASAPSYRAAKKGRGRRSSVRRALLVGASLSVLIALMIATPKAAKAGGTLVPEIDPGSMAGAMTLLVGGLLALTDRSRRS